MADRVLWVGLAGIAAFAAVMTVIEVDARRPRPEPHVELAEAEALFGRAVQLVQDKRFDEFCAKVAEHPQSCQTDLKNTVDIGWRPGPEPPKVVGVDHPGPGFPPIQLRITGHLDTGSAYTSSFGVRKRRDGRVVSSYPVYWTGTDFVDGPLAPKATEAT